jgi:uncharacterized membrane protein
MSVGKQNLFRCVGMHCYSDLSASHVFAIREYIVLKLSNMSVYLGYAVSAVTFIFGIVIVSGLAFQYIPVQMRLMFGIVMILWGMYRFVLTKTRARRQNEDKEE